MTTHLPTPRLKRQPSWQPTAFRFFLSLLTASDLAPADIILFPKVKSAMRGIQFRTSDEAVQAYMDELEKLEPSDYQNCFSGWFRRMDKCIDMNGEYFEKL